MVVTFINKWNIPDPTSLEKIYQKVCEDDERQLEIWANNGKGIVHDVAEKKGWQIEIDEEITKRGCEEIFDSYLKFKG